MGMVLPYRFRFTSRMADDAGTGQRVGLDVLDGDGLVRRATTINVANDAGLDDLMRSAHEQVQIALFVDAGGSPASVLDAVIGAKLVFDV